MSALTHSKVNLIHFRARQ